MSDRHNTVYLYDSLVQFGSNSNNYMAPSAIEWQVSQIFRTENHDDVYLFLNYMPGEIDPATGELPKYAYYPEADSTDKVVPLQALLPAFMLSELKTAFLIGFQICCFWGLKYLCLLLLGHSRLIPVERPDATWKGFV